MPSIEQLLGPLGLTAGALVAIGLMIRSFLKGDVVPGWLYRQEREQRMKAETQAERNAKALAEFVRDAIRQSGPPRPDA